MLNEKWRKRALLGTVLSCMATNEIFAQYQVGVARALLSVFAELLSVSVPLKSAGRTVAKISVSAAKVSLNVEREIGKSGVKVSTCARNICFPKQKGATYTV
jgi:hypothetical protein